MPCNVQVLVECVYMNTDESKVLKMVGGDEIELSELIRKEAFV